MASNAPWSVKGIDPKTREAAKESARRSGLTLGEWLNQRILEEGGEAEPAAEAAPVAARQPAALARPDFGAKADQMAGLSQKLEAVEQRTTLAFTGLDQSVRGVAARMEAVEKSAADNRVRLEDRVRKLEDDAVGPRSAEAIRSLETAFGKVASRANDVESRLSDGLDELRREVMALGRRLEDMERQKNASPEGRVLEQRMEQLAITLTQRVEAAKAEMSSAVEAAGARSAGAVERIGHEVLRMADSLDRRVQAVEGHAADAIEQVGGEVARAMTALDGRMQRSESLQSQALEKLGGEIARITERLTERIANAERRSAQAIDDVGEQVARVTERLNSRYDRTSSDLVDRIRQSEERTARLLEEAKERIEQRLAETRRPADAAAFDSEIPNPYSDPFSPAPVIYPDAAPFGQTFAPAGFTAIKPEFAREDLDAADNLATPLEPQTEADFMDLAEDPHLTLQPPPSPAEAELAEEVDASFAPLSFSDSEPEPVEPELADTELFYQPSFAGPEAPEEVLPDADEPFSPRQLHARSTRELIDQARAAARTAAQTPNKASNKGPRLAKNDDRRGSSGLTGSLFSSLGRKKANLKNSLMMSVAGLALLIAVGGYVILTGDFKGPMPARVAHNLGQPGGEYKGTEPDALPQAAVALDPRPIDASIPPPAAAKPAAPNASGLYVEGAQKIEAGDKAGLQPLERAANLGLPAAQAYLGRLYEKGSAGLVKNPVEARKWYERAAQAGDRSAMHNLALNYFDGTGGPKNLTVSAEWFRRAAMAGLTDSQYNLGRLYEEGIGVPQNPAEAFKWYNLAGRGGSEDQRIQARQAAARVGALISEDARNNAVKAANEIAVQAQATENLNAQLAKAPTPATKTQ